MIKLKTRKAKKMTNFHTNVELDGYITVNAIDDIVKVDCSTADGERLCSEVLDSAKWAEPLASGEYRIADEENMAALLEFIWRYNDTDDAGLRARAMTDWTLLDEHTETVATIDGDVVWQSGGDTDRFNPAGMWATINDRLRAYDPDGGDEHDVVVESGMVEIRFIARFDGRNWDTTLI